jgi:hypothetical protein
MLDPKNNMSLMAYINFKNYRDTVDLIESQNVSQPKVTDKKGLMTYSKNMVAKTKQQKISDNGQDKELRKVLDYVKMIEGMKGGD